MRILLICGSPYGVGTYVRAREFARWLVVYRHEVVLMYQGARRFAPTFQSQSGVLEIGVPSFLNRLDLDTMASPVGKLWVKSYIRKNRFDIVHGFEHYSIVSAACGFCHRKWGAPIISDWADWFSKAQNRRLFRIPGYRRLLGRREESVKRCAMGITVISRMLERRARNIDNRARVLYLPGGAPIDRIQPMDKRRCREQLGLGLDEVIYGYFGSFLSEELIPFLSAFKRLESQIRCRLLVIGRRNPVVNDFVEAEHLEGKIILTGYIEDESVNRYLGACDAFVLPMNDTEYNRSRWPNKIGDYFAAGRPVICSDIGEMQSVMAAGSFGIPVGQSGDEIFEAMKIYAEDEERRESDGYAARRYAEEHLSWQSLTKRLEDFYLDVASSSVH